MASKRKQDETHNSNGDSKTPRLRQNKRLDHKNSNEEDFSNIFKKEATSPKFRTRTLSILDVFEQTLCTQECVEQEKNSDQAISELDQPEDVDLGDIAFDIAIEAVDDISKIKDRLGNRIDQFKKEKDRIISHAKSKIDYKVNQAQTLRFIDKLTFFFGVIITYVDVYIMGRYPDNSTYNYKALVMFGLIGWRHINYRYNIYHYFLIDFCYIGNYIIFFMLFFCPTNRFFYLASYAIGSGTLGWATILVNNSFVLHSIDKITSCYLHLNPMLMMYNLHWVTQYNKDRGWQLYDTSEDKFTIGFVIYYYMAACTLYLSWALIYYLIIFVFRAKKIKERNYLTLFQWMSDTDKNAEKLWNKWGPKYSGLLFMTTHFIIFLMTTFISLISYFSFYFNVLCLSIVFCTCCWRGSCFYMDYFSKKYEFNLAKIEDEYNKAISTPIQK